MIYTTKVGADEHETLLRTQGKKTPGETLALVINLGICCKMPQYRLTDILYANNNMLHSANSLNGIHVMIT